MKLGAMQPYFFPYIGYFDLINRVDTWVVFDVVKYTRKSWMNRNRIINPAGGWQFITVPVHKRDEDSPIKDVELVDKDAAHRRITGQLQHYRKARAPFFSQTMSLVDQTFEASSGKKLLDLNVESLRVVAAYLRLEFSPVILSRSEIELPAISHPGQWALEIATALGHDTYINPPGGREIFRLEEFRERGVRLEFTDLLDFRYAPGPYEFVERLSILDVLMWNSADAVREYLRSL